jgi:hypothetical protein
MPEPRNGRAPFPDRRPPTRSVSSSCSTNSQASHHKYVVPDLLWRSGQDNRHQLWPRQRHSREPVGDCLIGACGERREPKELTVRGALMPRGALVIPGVQREGQSSRAVRDDERLWRAGGHTRLDMEMSSREDDGPGCRSARCTRPVLVLWTTAPGVGATRSWSRWGVHLRALPHRMEHPPLSG